MLRTVRGTCPFAILRVRRNASINVIRKVWMFEVRLWHPDKRHHDSLEDHSKARERFEDVQEAYEAIVAHRREFGEPAAEESGGEPEQEDLFVQLEAKLRKGLQELDKARQLEIEIQECHGELKKQLQWDHSEQDAEALFKAERLADADLFECRCNIRMMEELVRVCTMLTAARPAASSAVPAQRTADNLPALAWATTAEEPDASSAVLAQSTADDSSAWAATSEAPQHSGSLGRVRRPSLPGVLGRAERGEWHAATASQAPVGFAEVQEVGSVSAVHADRKSVV